MPSFILTGGATINGGVTITTYFAPFIGQDNPANALEPNATAWVLMDGPFYNTPGLPGSGFKGGQSWRKMAPATTTNGKTDYIYGDERVYWDGANWIYTNIFTGTISAGTGGDWPWLSTARYSLHFLGLTFFNI